jgi:hypothetical protein
MNSLASKSLFENAKREAGMVADVGAARAFTLAVEALRMQKPAQALDWLTDRFVEEGGPLAAAMTRGEIRKIAGAWLDARRRDGKPGTTVARAAVQGGAEAHATCDSQDIGRSAPPAPRRGPSELRAIANLRQPSIFDHVITIANRPIGDMRYADLQTFAARAAGEAAVLRALLDLGVPPRPDMTVRDYVPEADLKRIFKEARP